jgi:hypothetical protein
LVAAAAGVTSISRGTRAARARRPGMGELRWVTVRLSLARLTGDCDQRRAAVADGADGGKGLIRTSNVDR